VKIAFRILQIVAVVGMGIAMSGCGAISQMLASATPTPTQTPTITLTPTNTATATATATATPVPPPPVTITRCLGLDDCAQVRSILSFFAKGQEPATGQKYPVTIPAVTRLHFYWGWCATDQVTLMSSIKQYEFIFKIDDVSYVDKLERGESDIIDSQDPKVTRPCIAVGGYLTGWKPGETHTITIGGKVTAQTSDGWDTYPPGESVTSYVLSPIDVTNTPVPTLTFTPTRTPTRTHTPLPLPTRTPAPYIEPTVVCGETGGITLDNATNGIVTIYLKGPASYTYMLPIGSTKYTVCGGSYTFTAYGCGGASISGKIGTSNDTYYKFSCN
jgi:hypothetical protein